MRTIKMSPISAVVLLLAACSGSGGGGSNDNLLHGCQPISGGGTQTSSTASPTCTDCGVDSEAQAIDGDGGTYATLQMPANAGGTVTLRATAQDGIVYPSGSLAGMVHSIAYGTSTGLSITLVTYLDGTQQEQFNFNNGVGSSNQQPDQPGRASWTTTSEYDAVELNFTRVAGSGEVMARVHEFCSN